MDFLTAVGRVACSFALTSHALQSPPMAWCCSRGTPQPRGALSHRSGAGLWQDWTRRLAAKGCGDLGEGGALALASWWSRDRTHSSKLTWQLKL